MHYHESIGHPNLFSRSHKFLYLLRGTYKTHKMWVIFLNLMKQTKYCLKPELEKAVLVNPENMGKLKT